MYPPHEPDTTSARRGLTTPLPDLGFRSEPNSSPPRNQARSLPDDLPRRAGVQRRADHPPPPRGGSRGDGLQRPALAGHLRRRRQLATAHSNCCSNFRPPTRASLGPGAVAQLGAPGGAHRRPGPRGRRRRRPDGRRPARPAAGHPRPGHGLAQGCPGRHRPAPQPGRAGRAPLAVCPLLHGPGLPLRLPDPAERRHLRPARPPGGGGGQPARGDPTATCPACGPGSASRRRSSPTTARSGPAGSPSRPSSSSCATGWTPSSASATSRFALSLFVGLFTSAFAMLYGAFLVLLPALRRRPVRPARG